MRGIEQIIAVNNAACKAFDDARNSGHKQVYVIRDGVTNQRLFVFTELTRVAKFQESFDTGSLKLEIVNL